MEILHKMLHTYAQAFDWHAWAEVLTDPVSWGLIGTLVILEGLLSADNALVLATMVKPLPAEKQKKALTYGLFGAVFFRFLFIGLGMFLIKFWWIKVLGAAYLAWLVISHFFLNGNDEGGAKKPGFLVRVFGVFWGTVIAVELMDLAFSVDSILAALAISEKVWVLLLGGVLGIIMMRTVAGFFLRLMDRIPELEHTAFILIAIIALKMFASVFHYELPHTAFFIIVILAFVITFIIHKRNQKKHHMEEVAASKEDE
ncbi:TerC family protein [Priestia endophytica]|jgi:YkoY family integral membrane protein|uniref:DUF475 domain-containing protein n=1 Tax=Priestia endophytica TaxID=135735 RepID=A0AAX1QGR8_9BACI|nr:TerC family protein [Priestia endophytica]RAS80846.1 hypothetical protein A3864_03705 [Priestia endophytica]